MKSKKKLRQLVAKQSEPKNLQPKNMFKVSHLPVGTSRSKKYYQMISAQVELIERKAELRVKI